MSVLLERRLTFFHTPWESYESPIAHTKTINFQYLLNLLVFFFLPKRSQRGGLKETREVFFRVTTDEP